MDAQQLPAILRAIIGTTNEAVRGFLTVHLRARGFAVETAFRAEYLAHVVKDADVLFCDAGLFRQADLAPDQQPFSVLLLSEQPSADEALLAAMSGVRRYLTIPFVDPPALAETLDLLALEAHERRRIRNRELVTTP